MLIRILRLSPACLFWPTEIGGFRSIVSRSKKYMVASCCTSVRLDTLKVHGTLSVLFLDSSKSRTFHTFHLHVIPLLWLHTHTHAHTQKTNCFWKEFREWQTMNLHHHGYSCTFTMSICNLVCIFPVVSGNTVFGMHGNLGWYLYALSLYQLGSGVFIVWKAIPSLWSSRPMWGRWYLESVYKCPLSLVIWQKYNRGYWK